MTRALGRLGEDAIWPIADAIERHQGRIVRGFDWDPKRLMYADEVLPWLLRYVIGMTYRVVPPLELCQPEYRHYLAEWVKRRGGPVDPRAH